MLPPFRLHPRDRLGHAGTKICLWYKSGILCELRDIGTQIHNLSRAIRDLTEAKPCLRVDQISDLLNIFFEWACCAIIALAASLLYR